MNFSKLLLVTMVTSGAMSLAGQATAFAPNWTADKDNADGSDVSTVAIWHAGASASTSSMQKAVMDAVCSNASPVDIQEDARSYATAPTATTAGVARPAFWTVSCISKVALGTFPVGTKVMWSKRDEGGSGVGVGPLANSVDIAFMKPSTGPGPDGIPSPVFGTPGDDTNCPGNGAANSGGGTTNNYLRSVTIDGVAVNATVHNCLNFTYKLVPATPAVTSEIGVSDDAVKRKPDIGTSDIEPDKFAPSLIENNPKTDFGLTAPAGLITLQTYAPPASADVGAFFTSSNSQPVAMLTFGIPVNVRMYQDLQRMQFPAGHPLNLECHPNGATYGNVTAAVYDASGNATSGGILDPRNNANAEKCMPSLTSNEIRSILSSTAAIKSSTDFQYMSTYNDATAPLATLLATANGASNNAIEICRRVKGSGTQAQANAIFMGYPCDINTDGSIDSLIMSFQGQLGATTIDNEGSGDVELCMNDYNNGANASGQNSTLLKRWAVGIQSLEKNAPNFTTNTFANAYRFIKIDGFAPTLANVHAGDYYDFAAQSLQYRSSENPATFTPPATPASVFPVANSAYLALAASIKDVTVLPGLSKTHVFGTAGWLAIPTTTIKPDAALSLTRPVSWYRRVSSSGKFNTCALPSLFNAKGGAVVNNSATVGPQNCSRFTVGGPDNNCYTNVNPVSVSPTE